GHNLMSVFIDDSEVVKIGYSYLMIVGSFYLVFSLMFCNSGFFRGAGDTLIPMFITLLSLWVFRVPASIILSKYFGTDGIWWGIPIAWAIGLIISYGYYLSGKWRNKAVVKKVFVPEPVEEPTTNL
ncbi:MAG: MATE family efflux transporter, partial [Bacteroidota bacterium]